MGQISAMEYGSLKAEVRIAKEGSSSGPYYQHQVWENGKNISQRIPADQAPALQGAIDGRQQFEQLAEEYVDTTVQMTRAYQGLSTESKKTPDVPIGNPYRSGSIPNSGSCPDSEKKAGIETSTGWRRACGKLSLIKDGRTIIESLLNDGAIEVPEDVTREGEKYQG